MKSSSRNLLILFGSILAAVAVTALLVNIFEHKQESKLSYLKIVDIKHGEPDLTACGLENCFRARSSSTKERTAPENLFGI